MMTLPSDGINCAELHSSATNLSGDHGSSECAFVIPCESNTAQTEAGVVTPLTGAAEELARQGRDPRHRLQGAV